LLLAVFANLVMTQSHREHCIVYMRKQVLQISHKNFAYILILDKLFELQNLWFLLFS